MQNAKLVTPALSLYYTLWAGWKGNDAFPTQNLSSLEIVQLMAMKQKSHSNKNNIRL